MKVKPRHEIKKEITGCGNKMMDVNVLNMSWLNWLLLASKIALWLCAVYAFEKAVTLIDASDLLHRLDLVCASVVSPDTSMLKFPLTYTHQILGE